MAAQAPSTRSYVFQNEPRAVVTSHQRAKYRENDPKSLMTDKRVVRGNTYSAIMPTPQQRRAMESQARTLEAAHLRKTQLRETKIRQTHNERAARARSPPPVVGRSHALAQTDDYLEELADKVLEKDVDTQTEASDDRPPPPVFVPKPVGTDRATEIAAGDLFDYDLAVEPILEVLVGKCLDQSLLEVLEEEEIKNLEAARLAFEQRRDAMISEAQRLEAATVRRHEEKERRVKQERERYTEELLLARKLQAQSTSRQFLANLHNEVLQHLERRGTLFDPVATEVERSFLPWIVANVAQQLQQVGQAREEVDVLLQRAVNTLTHQRQEKLRLQREAQEAEARRVAEEAQRRAEAERRQKEEEEAQRAREAEEAERRRKEEEELLAAGDGEGDGEGEDGEDAGSDV